MIGLHKALVVIRLQANHDLAEGYDFHMILSLFSVFSVPAAPALSGPQAGADAYFCTR
jgi:hypothetical protein